MTIEQSLCELTKILWRYHLIEPSEEHAGIVFDMCSEDMVAIGTGKGEFFVSRSQLAKNQEQVMKGNVNISFDVIDEWYECLKVTENVRLVYGGLWVREKDREQAAALVDMDSRFSVLYREVDEGKWEIVHVHQSMPFFEQQEGEFYPKTLSQKAREAMVLAEVYQRRSEIDRMTGLYNNESFKYYAKKRLADITKAYLYIFDLDYFKGINDTFGHMAGDRALKLFSTMIKRYFTKEAVTGRLGGDEFIVLQCMENIPHQESKNNLYRMMEEYRKRLAEILTEDNYSGFSVGIAQYENGAPGFQELLEQADRALYQAKQNRGTVFYAMENVSKLT